jgi:hypothetical protein
MPSDHAPRDRGCDYCADDANMHFGHLVQIASDETSRTLLLRCPRCGSYYKVTHSGSVQVTRLPEADAAAGLSG